MQVRRGIALETRRPGALLTLTAAAVLFVDQLTKALVRTWFEPAQSFPLIDGVFHLTYVRNTGAAFGLMPGHRPLFVTATVLVLAAIAVYWWRARPNGLVLVASLGLISGGAIGNLIDRVVAGRVTDFFDFRVFPVFNMADIALVVGGAGMFAWALFAPLDGPGASVAASDPEHSPGDDEVSE